MAGRYRGITRRGQGWQLSFAYNGIRCREVVRLPNSQKGQQQAFNMRAAILAEIDRGTFDYSAWFPRSKRATELCQRRGERVTVQEALMLYLSRKSADLSYSTQRDYEYRIYAHLIPRFGKMSLASLKPSDVREWRDSCTLSNKTKNNILIPLRDVFREAYLDELIDKDPLDRVRALPVAQREPHPFTKSEVRLILAELLRRSADVADYFKLAFGSGLRTSELLALTWDDIQLDTSKIVVNKAKVRGRVKVPKTAAGRRLVEMTSMAREAISSLMARRSDQPELFLNPLTGKPWKNGQTLRKGYWYPALDKLGVPRRNPYQTRHTFASRLLSDGANPLYVAVQMGHKDWGMIRQVYGRYISDAA